MRSWFCWALAGVAIWLMADDSHLQNGIFESVPLGVAVAAVVCLLVALLFSLLEDNLIDTSGGRNSPFSWLLFGLVILFILWLAGAI